MKLNVEALTSGEIQAGLKNNKLSTLLLSCLLTASQVHATSGIVSSPQFQSPAQPSIPERGGIPNSQQLTPQIDPDAPCHGSSTDYAEMYMAWIEKPPSLLNECGLGRLINFQLLQGFDPFGAMISAIKGAVCGFIKNEISDPFVNKINARISDANRWVQDTNSQYSSWIDESARQLGQSIYDPRSHFARTTFPEGMAPPSNTQPPTNSFPYPAEPTEPPISNPTPTLPAEPTDDDILDGGGSVDIGDNDDGTGIIISDPTPSTGFDDSNWDTMYNVYE